MSTAAAEASDGSMTLNFSLPHETIYSEAKVSQVIVPGAAGEYGITADHVPIVAQLKPGVLQIMHEGAEPEKYFVAGGFSLTHDNSVTVRLIVVSHCCWFWGLPLVFRPYFRIPVNLFFVFSKIIGLRFFILRSDSMELTQHVPSPFKPNQYKQDISCPEAVKLDDIDPAAVTSNYEAAKAAFSSAESGSVAAAEAQIDIEVNRAMGAAIGLTLN